MIQNFHGTYGTEGKLKRQKSKSGNCAFSMLKSETSFLSAEENPAFFEHSLVFQPYCR